MTDDVSRERDERLAKLLQRERRSTLFMNEMGPVVEALERELEARRLVREAFDKARQR